MSKKITIEFEGDDAEELLEMINRLLDKKETDSGEKRKAKKSTK